MAWVDVGKLSILINIKPGNYINCNKIKKKHYAKDNYETIVYYCKQIVGIFC